tara:strand:- start:1188 stop:1610 length:423 start_codon:yes stop_codon:yes gene_type:complete
MFKFFKKKNVNETKSISTTSLACLLIHAAKIDEKYSNNEKKIIRDTLIKLGLEESKVDDTLNNAELIEQDSNQILEFTKEAKNLEYNKKIILIEALWSIIFSDKNVDMYEANLMRRLSGLLYLDKKVVGDIKEKIKNQKL